LSDKFSAAKPVRKRRWGSTSVQHKPVLSVNISTDSLKVQLMAGPICQESWTVCLRNLMNGFYVFWPFPTGSL